MQMECTRVETFAIFPIESGPNSSYMPVTPARRRHGRGDREGVQHDPRQPHGRLWCRGHDPHRARTARPAHRREHRRPRTGVPQPSASKLLKLLARAGILTSHRGAKGGYVLAHAPDQVSVADLVAAVDGPISLADCLDGPSGICELESFCSVRGPWQKISDAIRVALEEVTLGRHGPGRRGRRANDPCRRRPWAGSTRHERPAGSRAGGRVLRRRALQVRLRHRRRGRLRAPRSRPRHHPLHLRQEGRAGVAIGVADQGFRALA